MVLQSNRVLTTPLLHHFSVRALNDKKQINYKRQRPLKVGAAFALLLSPAPEIQRIVLNDR